MYAHITNFVLGPSGSIRRLEVTLEFPDDSLVLREPSPISLSMLPVDSQDERVRLVSLLKSACRTQGNLLSRLLLSVEQEHEAPDDF